VIGLPDENRHAVSVRLNCLFLLSSMCPGGFPAAVTGTYWRRWVVAPDDSHDISTHGLAELPQSAMANNVALSLRFVTRICHWQIRGTCIARHQPARSAWRRRRWGDDGTERL